MTEGKQIFLIFHTPVKFFCQSEHSYIACTHPFSPLHTHTHTHACPSLTSIFFLCFWGWGIFLLVLGNSLGSFQFCPAPRYTSSCHSLSCWQ